MKRKFGTMVALMVALVALSIGRASALSISMTPPAGTTSFPTVACPALSGNTGTNGVYTITDLQCARSLIASGWGVIGNSHSWLSGGSAAVVSNSAAAYTPISGTATSQASNEGDVAITAPTVGTLSNFECVLTDATGTVTVAGGTSYVLALRKNLATSALTCTILAAASSCKDTTHQVVTAIGDTLDVIDTPSGTPTALVVHCGVQVGS